MSEDLPLKDHNNGTYEIFFNFPKAGILTLKISCDGAAIQGSPFSINIVE